MKHVPTSYRLQRISVSLLLAWASTVLVSVPGLAQSQGDSSDVINRRIWSFGPGQFPWTTGIPDGRHIAYTDWSQLGILAVLDLATGEARELTSDTLFTRAGSQFAEISVVSPDGEQIAYAWFNGEHYELRVIGLDGSEPRVLFKNPEVFWLGPMQWSPDGSQILTIWVTRDNWSQVALVATSDGSHRILETAGIPKSSGRNPSAANFSPDGRYIARARPPDENSSQRDIFVLATDGSREIRITQHPADDYLLGWAPDGTILFGSDRGGTPGAWSIRMEGGEPRGDPVLVKADMWGLINLIGFTRQGSFYYTVDAGTREVYVATLDSANGSLTGTPTSVGGAFRALAVKPDWSPDGSYLAFLTSRGPHYSLGSRGIAVRSLATGDVRELVPNLADIGLLRWTPDGQAFFVIGNDDKRRRGVYRVDAHTAEVTPIVRGVPRPGRNFASDGNTLYYDLGYWQPTRKLVARDLRSGHERELHTFEGPFGLNSLALSPDARQLAFFARRETEGYAVQLLATAGGSPRVLLPVPDGDEVGGIEWTRDGRYLLITGSFPSRAEQGGRAARRGTQQVLRVPVEGGDPVSVGSIRSTTGLRLHPDGRQIAYVTSTFQYELWVMENILGVGPAPVSPSRRQN